MPVATGFAQGPEANADVVRRAVELAMQGVSSDIANSVLLFVTSAFQLSPVLLRTASRVANCTQIMGCVAPGIFTETNSAIHVPAAAAMVLTEGIKLAGSNVTPVRLRNALESIRKFDLGGLEVSYSTSNHTGLDFVDLSIIDAGGRFRR